MLAQFVEKIQKLQENNSVFQGIKRGIERESLRVTPQGSLAETLHSKSLGSKLTHPHITTDYSENLLELISSPFESADELLGQLHDIHAYTLDCIGSEHLWPLSMPCWLGSNDEIPIANYGTSNSGQMKMQYRRGLGHRYGRHMQTIAGLHFNFSLPKNFWALWYANIDGNFENQQACSNHYHMNLIRNYLRHAWFIYYLFGASPAVHSTFFNHKNAIPKFLTDHDHQFYSASQGTALRMSEIGYQSLVQDHMPISYNSLNEYTSDLEKATKTSLHMYEIIKEQYGEAAQLNTNVLQIEAEFYAAIRPKQTFCPGKRPVFTLQDKGIEYIEVRAIDINPFAPLGITKEQILFMDVFLTYCLLQDSPIFSSDDQKHAHDNQINAVRYGRDAECMLQQNGKPIKLTQWADSIMADLIAVAALLDTELPDNNYTGVVESFKKQLASPDTLLSAQYLNELKQNGSYIDYANALARQHKQYFTENPLSKEKHKEFAEMAKASLAKQKAIEQSDSMPYEEYVRRYFEVYC